MSYVLYMHKCNINNKIYIGITGRNPEVRWNNGYGYHGQKYFYRAIQKYGWDNFQHIILVDNLSKEWACRLEQDLIWRYKSNLPEYGYNLTDGGEGPFGHIVTEETRRKISLSHYNSTKCRGYHLSEETKEKIGLANRGKIVSQETRDKLSKINKGRIPPNKGKPMSDEQKLKIGRANSGKHLTEEQKEQLRRINLGKKQSEETKLKRSEKMKGLRYVNNGYENHRVHESELSNYLEQGYVLGLVHNKDKKNLEEYF